METLRRHSTANNSALKIIFTVLFIILPFVGFYWGMKYQGSITEVSEPPTPLVRKPTPMPTLPITTDTTNWKTYTNQEISFKYPKDLSVEIFTPTNNQTTLTLRQKNNVPLFVLNIFQAENTVNASTYLNTNSLGKRSFK